MGKSEIFYARLTVKPADRKRAGATRLFKSLETKDKEIALKRWPAAYQQLQEELKLRLGSPITEHHLIRARLESGFAETMQVGEGEAGARTLGEVQRVDPEERAAQILNVQVLDPDNELHEQTFKAVKTGKFVTWDDVLQNHIKVKKRKTSRGLAPVTILKLENIVKAIQSICPYPNDLDKTKAKQLIAQLENEGVKPITISTKVGLLKAAITSAIKQDVVSFEINPFSTIDFSAQMDEEDKRRGFELKTELPLLLSSKYGNFYRLLCGTGMRINEAMSRDLEKDIDGQMLIVREDLKAGKRLKTSSSIRRVPLDEQAMEALKELRTHKLANKTLRNNLNKVIHNLFDNDPLLVTHSCRHTYKTITRVVGVSHEISDSISGHLKSTVSKTSDGYGEYPDELLITENQKVWDYLSKLN